jgi:hypothetical protein
VSVLSPWIKLLMKELKFGKNLKEEEKTAGDDESKVDIENERRLKILL